MTRSGLFRALAVLVLPLLPPEAAFAQTTVPLPRPDRGILERPPLPEYAPGEPSIGLPPVPRPAERAPLSQTVRIHVQGYRFVGNTAVPESELGRIAAPFAGREVTAEELQELRYRLTEAYVDRGFITSGAVLPDQDVADGIITFQIVEGRLADIAVTGTEGLDPRYVERRLARGIGEPLDVAALREGILLLLQDPLIERMNAGLVPGTTLGESRLNVEVTRARPYELRLNFDNGGSPSTGELRGTAHGVLRNLTGWGDALEVNVEKTRGLRDLWAAWEMPITESLTRVRFRIQDSRARIVEEPLDELDIESRVRSYEVGVTHPVVLTSRDRVEVGLTLQRSETDTFLLGRRFSFTEGVRDGRATVTAVRFSQTWLRRHPDDVIAARSVFSFGIDAFGSTINGPGQPDSRFITWLGQFQWAHRLDERGDQIVVRVDAQLSNDALLPSERIALGGAESVRGYRENTLVRDQGVIASVEGRIPLFRAPVPALSREAEDGRVSLVPFVDFGRAWNRGTPTPEPRIIASAGLGLRWDVSPDLSLELAYGHPLRHIEERSGHSFQERGIHFRIAGRVF